MAGDIQHFIPQFVQRGFASRGIESDAMTWVYRRGQDPFESNIRRVSAERHFYGSATDRRLDDAITDLESEGLGALWHSLSTMVPGPVTEVDHVARLIAHLETRTKNVRLVLADPAETLLEAIARVFEDQKGAVQRIVRWVRSDPSMIVDEATKRFGVNPTIAEALVRGMSDDQLAQFAGPLANSLREALQEIRRKPNMGDVFKRGHNDALLRTLAAPQRAEAYRQCQFQVLQYATSEPLLVLGDSVCVFESADGEYRPLHDVPNPVSQILVPLTSRRVLVGGSDLHALEPTASEIRNAAIRCSRTQFIASICSPELQAAVNELGAWSAMLSKADIDDITDDALRSLFPAKE
jgi:hypothetical protein